MTKLWHRDLISSRQITKYRHGDQMSSCQVICEPQNVTTLSPWLMRLSTFNLVYKLTIQMVKSLFYLVEYYFRFFYANNLKPIYTVTDSVENKSVSSTNILKYLRIFRKLFSFCLINPQLSYSLRKVSANCSETVAMYLHIIGNTFGNIRAISDILHVHHSIGRRVLPFITLCCFVITCPKYLFYSRI